MDVQRFCGDGCRLRCFLLQVAAAIFTIHNYIPLLHVFFYLTRGGSLHPFLPFHSFLGLTFYLQAIFLIKGAPCHCHYPHIPPHLSLHLAVTTCLPPFPIRRTCLCTTFAGFLHTLSCVFIFTAEHRQVMFPLFRPRMVTSEGHIYQLHPTLRYTKEILGLPPLSRVSPLLNIFLCFASSHSIRSIYAGSQLRQAICCLVERNITASVMQSARCGHQIAQFRMIVNTQGLIVFNSMLVHETVTMCNSLE